MRIYCLKQWILWCYSKVTPSNLVSDLSHAAAAAKSHQLCPTLCDPTDRSLPGSPINTWKDVHHHSLFSWVQFSRSVMSDSLRPHKSQHAMPPCPSPSPRVHSNSRPSSQWCHPAISSSVVPFSSCSLIDFNSKSISLCNYLHMWRILQSKWSSCFPL